MTGANEPRCDRCKHWGTDNRWGGDATWEARKVGFRRCAAVKERWKILNSGAWREEEQATQKLREARAYVEDGSEYMAVLLTGSDFFCALFDEQAIGQRQGGDDD